MCQCGCQMQRVGEDVAEKLDYMPGVSRSSAKGQCTITDTPGRWHSIRMQSAGVDNAVGCCTLTQDWWTVLRSMGTNVGV